MKKTEMVQWFYAKMAADEELREKFAVLNAKYADTKVDNGALADEIVALAATESFHFTPDDFKEYVASVSGFAELTDDELAAVAGGSPPVNPGTPDGELPPGWCNMTFPGPGPCIECFPGGYPREICPPRFQAGVISHINPPWTCVQTGNHCQRPDGRRFLMCGNQFANGFLFGPRPAGA